MFIISKNLVTFLFSRLNDQDFERQLAEERRRNQEKEEKKREAERLQERGGWNVLEGDNQQGSDDSMDVDSHDKGIQTN